jgi:hypothetical protein
MWELGIIVSDSGEVIVRPGMTIDELLKTTPGHEARVSETGPGWKRVELGPITIAGYCDFYMAVYCNECRVQTFDINLGDEAVKRLWQGQSADAELNFYRALVEKETGHKSPASFDWGAVAAFKDHWTLLPSISFRYGNMTSTNHGIWKRVGRFMNRLDQWLTRRFPPN